YARTSNFGRRAAFTRRQVFAIWSLSTPERHAERPQQRLALAVGARGGDDRHRKALHLVDLVDVDLREDDLLGDAERVVAATVERAVAAPLETAPARQGDGQHAIEDLVHAPAAQRDHRADRHVLAQLEVRDRLARAGDDRLLTGDRRQPRNRRVEHLDVLDRL